MPRSFIRPPLLAALATLLLAPPAATAAVELPGLEAPVTVTMDGDGVPHIEARSDTDASRVLGWVHARDRFFQMDQTRRMVDGTLSELLGAGSIGGDIQGRTFGLHRAAARSEAVLSERERAVLQGYADGVNAYLGTHPLPIEYTELELTQARPWAVVDTLSIGKAIAASLSLDIDLGALEDLEDYVAAGDAQGFDGAALYFDDVNRVAPFDPASTIPDATGGTPFVTAQARSLDRKFLAKAGAASERIRQDFAQHPLLAAALERREGFVGSNEWGVAAQHSAGGRPIIANDPHLALNIPATFYEVHVTVTSDPVAGRMNVSGIGFPGAPGVILGQNEHITWGATTNPMDVTDVFLDELLAFQPECTAIGSLLCIRSAGQIHPVDFALASYNANNPDDGILDNVELFPLPLASSVVATVPFRSFGPVIDVEDANVLASGGVTTAAVLQYTGFHATREVQTFLQWNRARNLDEFLVGLADFDVGSQNWAYADDQGNLAYFASAELPLRTDLEQGFVDGLPPWFVRDGSGDSNWVADPARSQGQAIPFSILPFEEMPHTVNPENGFFVNANNDPAGTSLDNDVLNQFRPSKPGAIYYLSGGYSDGLRAGRITQLVRDAVQGGGKVSVNQMKRFQSNTQQLDAEVMTPFVVAAYRHAVRPKAAPELAALGADPHIAEAVERLAAWDFSTPTGIPEGYDAHDANGRRTRGVSRPEADASVAATIYNLWRGKAIRSIVDARLSQLGLGTGSSQALVALRHLLDQPVFTGVGASGVDFFPGPAGSSAADRRDVALLSALRDALDALASTEFAPAFGGSTNQDDYRWGKLHRITFDHPFIPEFSVPPAGGFADLSPDLPGVARDGGLEVVNASGFSRRADSLQGFRFGGGPVRRYVGEAGVGAGPGGNVRGFNVVPGGPSGDPNSPDYTTQLGTWLTADYHRVRMRPPYSGSTRGPERFVPAP